MTKKCQNEIDLLDTIATQNMGDECMKQHDNYTSQQKCLKKGYKNIEKIELPYYKCLDKHCTKDKRTIKRTSKNTK